MAILALVVAAISTPVYAHRILTPTNNDYGTHIQFALDMLRHKAVPSYTLAHPAIQGLLIGILWITRGRVNLWNGMVASLVLAQVLTALILYAWFGALHGRWSSLRRALCAGTLTLVAPIMALVSLDGLYYFGYIGLASYHNPTVHLLRPFALVSFYFAVRSLNISRSPGWMVAASALVIVISALIKPNFALVILPALGLLVMLAQLRPLLRRQPVDWRMALLGFALPGCLVLAVQGIVTYADGGSIMLSPLAVESGYSGYLLPKFFLSIIFPLVLLVAYFPRVWKNKEMALAWLVFAAGVLQSYLFAEGGDRLMHGNFRWSAQIGLFLLFAVSAHFLLHTPFPADRRGWARRLLVAAAYLLHLAAGMLYYLHAFTAKGYG